MNDKDQIKDLFAEKLSQMEVPVRSEIWTAFSSQIGASTAAVGGTGLSLVSKIIIGISVIAASTVAGVYVLSDKPSEEVGTEVKAEKLLTTDESSDESIVPPTQNANETAPKLITNEVLNEESVDDNTPNQVLNNPAPNVVELPPVSYQSANPTEHKTNAVQATTSAVNTNQTAKAPSSPVVTVVEDDPHVDEVAINEQKSAVEIKLPNVFTPNGDRDNDEFFIESEGLSDFNIVILDASNRIVYQSADPNFRWDGRNQAGDIVADGNFVYYITAIDAHGKKLSRYSMLRVQR